MPRKPAHIEGQISFDNQFTFGPNISGVAVDVQTRALFLRSSAINHGKSNSRIGMSDAVLIEPHSTEIWGRLKRSTEIRVQGALNNATEFEKKAKKDFWIATGLGAVVASRELDIGEDEAKALARVWYRSFTRKMYGGESGEAAKKIKSRFIGNLNRQITAQQRLRRLAKQKRAGRDAA